MHRQRDVLYELFCDVYCPSTVIIYQNIKITVRLCIWKWYIYFLLTTRCFHAFVSCDDDWRQQVIDCIQHNEHESMSNVRKLFHIENESFFVVLCHIQIQVDSTSMPYNFIYCAFLVDWNHHRMHFVHIAYEFKNKSNKMFVQCDSSDGDGDGGVGHKRYSYNHTYCMWMWLWLLWIFSTNIQNQVLDSTITWTFIFLVIFDLRWMFKWLVALAASIISAANH